MIINDKKILRDKIKEFINDQPQKAPKIYNEHPSGAYVLVIINYAEGWQKSAKPGIKRDYKKIKKFFDDEGMAYTRVVQNSAMRYSLFEYIVTHLGEKALIRKYRKSEAYQKFIKIYGDIQNEKMIKALYSEYIQDKNILNRIISISNENIGKIIDGAKTDWDESPMRILIPRHVRDKELDKLIPDRHLNRSEIPGSCKGSKGTLGIKHKSSLLNGGIA